ncbi:MAG: hypothetical protein RL071_5004 [Pseudomonadota bacterium]
MTLRSPPLSTARRAALCAPHRRAAFALSLLLVACEDGTKDGAQDDTGGVTGDDGGDDGAPNYEEGCITVDGGGGYRWINDAIAVAEPGSVIGLCAESAHEEEVIVSKAVQIVGPGAEEFVLVAPTNTVGLTITADGASVEGIRVESLRTAVSVEPAEIGAAGPAGVSLSGLILATAGNWGLSANGATDLVVTDTVFGGNGYGGLHAEGASVRVVNGSFVDNIGYGVHADAGSSVSLEGGEIRSTFATNPDDIADGHGMYAIGGSTIAADGVVFADNTFVNLFAEAGDVVLANSTVTGALYGVVALAGDVELRGSTLTDSAYHGVYAATTGAITVDAVTISGDRALTVDIADSTWGVADADGAATYLGVGAFFVSDNVQVSGLDVVGYNNGGALIAGYNATGAVATVSSSTFTDNGRKGLYISGIQTTLTDVTVTGQIEVEDYGDERCGIVDRYGAIINVGAALTVVGGNLSDNGGYGISNVSGVVVAEGLTVAGNICAGIINFRGSAEVRNSDFSRPGETGLSASVLDYESNGLVVSGSTFHDSQTPTELIYEYDYTDYIVKYVYQVNYGQDVVAYSGAGIELDGNSFSSGTAGVQLLDTPAEITGNTFEGYLSDAIYVSGAEPVRIRESAFSNVAGNAVNCFQGNITLENSTIEDGAVYVEPYTYYQDDVMIFEAASESIGRGMYGYDCNLSMDSVEVSGMPGALVSGYTNTAASYALNDVSIDGLTLDTARNYQSALDISASYGTTDIVLSNVTATNIGEYAFLEVFNDFSGNAYTGTVDVELDTVEISNVAGAAVQLSGDGVSATLTDVDIRGAALGLQLEYGTFTLDGVAVSEGVDSPLLSWGGSGVYLNGGTFTMVEAASTSNPEYGLVCSNAPTIDSCATVTLADNLIGPSLGCDTACGLTP